MEMSTHSLNHGSSLTLRVPGENDPSHFAMVIGRGRGCTLKVTGPVAGVWILLRGRLHLTEDETSTVLYPSDMRVTEFDNCMRAVGRGSAMWLALLGSEPAWREALAGSPKEFVLHPSILPSTCTVDRSLRRRATELARAATRGTRGDLEMVVNAIVDEICDLQSPLDAAIERCPGRSYSQRRQVFLRLQRVRNYLAVNCHLELDNGMLARMANYSPWQFIRAFSAAYQETPHAYLVTQRLLRARHLLGNTSLAINEIAVACGFENPCAFSRLFRRRFMTTATTVRREHTTAALYKNDLLVLGASMGFPN